MTSSWNRKIGLEGERMEPAFDLRPLPTDNINGAPLMPRTRKWRTSYYKTLIRSVTGELQPRS